MSRNERGVPTLLSTFKNQKRANEPWEPADPHAPPEASSDEEDQESDTTTGSYPQRGDIQKTKFEAKPGLKKNSSPAQSPQLIDERRVTRPTRSASLGKRASFIGDQRLPEKREAEEVPNDLPATKRRKQGQDGIGESPGAQHASDPFEQHKKPTVTYKKRTYLGNKDPRGTFTPSCQDPLCLFFELGSPASHRGYIQQRQQRIT